VLAMRGHIAAQKMATFQVLSSGIDSGLGGSHGGSQASGDASFDLCL
jgi:hypothetical protein